MGRNTNVSPCLLDVVGNCSLSCLHLLDSHSEEMKVRGKIQTEDIDVYDQCRPTEYLKKTIMWNVCGFQVVVVMQLYENMTKSVGLFVFTKACVAFAGYCDYQDNFISRK